MSEIISKAALEARQQQFKPASPARVGTRVELVSMTDPYTALKPGERGTVTAVDSIGTVFVAWDCGSTLGVAYGADEIRVLTVIPAEIVEQILKIRTLPHVPNMFAVKDVFEFAMELGGFDELCDYLFMHTNEYSHFILIGETEW